MNKDGSVKRDSKQIKEGATPPKPPRSKPARPPKKK